MASISKHELMQLIDQALPDDVKIIGASAMAGETFELTLQNVKELFAPSSAVCYEYDDVKDSDYVLVTV